MWAQKEKASRGSQRSPLRVERVVLMYFSLASVPSVSSVHLLTSFMCLELAAGDLSYTLGSSTHTHMPAGLVSNTDWTLSPLSQTHPEVPSQSMQMVLFIDPGVVRKNV